MPTNLIEYIWPGIIASEAIHVAASGDDCHPVPKITAQSAPVEW
jgi:hypothetical protein